MVGKPTFYALWVAFCLGTTAGLMIISQLAPFAASGGADRNGSGLDYLYRRGTRQQQRTYCLRVDV